MRKALVKLGAPETGFTRALTYWVSDDASIGDTVRVPPSNMLGLTTGVIVSFDTNYDGYCLIAT